ncbi:MAG: hypothetical protein ACI4JY_01910 [Oscillospiraceae bacterium]
MGIEVTATSGGFWHGDKAVVYAPGTDTSYTAELSEDGAAFVTLKENDGRYIADARG